MFLRFETLMPKKLVGKRLDMSLLNNQSFKLWSSFMPHRNSILHTIGTDLYSVQFYNQTYFNSYQPEVIFEKWATREVSTFEAIPNEMETLILNGGLYAVFVHKGMDTEAAKTFNYIFLEWLPSSNFQVDSRAHFEVLGEKYKRNSADSEEEIWVPVMPK